MQILQLFSIRKFSGCKVDLTLINWSGRKNFTSKSGDSYKHGFWKILFEKSPAGTGTRLFCSYKGNHRVVCFLKKSILYPV